MTTFELSEKEIILIKRLRKCDFGVIEVHKVDGELIRTIIKVNELIKEVNKNE